MIWCMSWGDVTCNTFLSKKKLSIKIMLALLAYSVNSKDISNIVEVHIFF